LSSHHHVSRSVASPGENSMPWSQDPPPPLVLGAEIPCLPCPAHPPRPLLSPAVDIDQGLHPAIHELLQVRDFSILEVACHELAIDLT
jgi:hypothetical protein